MSLSPDIFKRPKGNTDQIWINFANWFNASGSPSKIENKAEQPKLEDPSQTESKVDQINLTLWRGLDPKLDYVQVVFDYSAPDGSSIVEFANLLNQGGKVFYKGRWYQLELATFFS